MKRIATLTLLALSFSLPVATPRAASGPCQVERTQYRGWNSYKLSNGLISLLVVPELGGRVIQFQLGEHPYFFVHPDLAGKVFPPAENGGGNGGWKNYGGSKVWPAPQGWENDQQWPGPPDPVLDGGKYEGRITRQETNQVAVTLTSPEDQRTGLRFSRTIHLFAGSTRVRLDHSMRNVSQRPVRWAIWEVTQLDTADPKDPTRFNPDFWAYCPINPRSAHPRGFSTMFGQATHPSFQRDHQNGLLTVQYDHRVGKVGLDSTAGWLAAVNGLSDHCFVGQFKPFPNQPYPDHASVEFWLNGAGEFILNGLAITNAANPKETPYLMEAEILGPLANLQPEQESKFQTDWFATRCPRPIVDTTPVAAVHKPFAVARAGNQVTLEGVFGVFYRGKIEAVFKGVLGEVLGRLDLGAVDPHRVLRLAKQLTLPEQAFRVSVSLLDETGQDRGPLGNQAIPAQPR